MARFETSPAHTKTLCLLRHAKSSWDNPDLDDYDRPLAKRGRKAAQLVASELARRGSKVDLVLSSSAARARQTLEIVLPALGLNVEVRIEPPLYGAAAADLVLRLRRVDEAARTVLIVGHNPALQDLAVALAGDGDRTALDQLHQKFPTGALATMNTETNWSELGPAACHLVSLVLPRDLEIHSITGSLPGDRPSERGASRPSGRGAPRPAGEFPG